MNTRVLYWQLMISDSISMPRVAEAILGGVNVYAAYDQYRNNNGLWVDDGVFIPAHCIMKIHATESEPCAPRWVQ